MGRLQSCSLRGSSSPRTTPSLVEVRIVRVKIVRVKIVRVKIVRVKIVRVKIRLLALSRR
jgi:hypothetical protein